MADPTLLQPSLVLDSLATLFSSSNYDCACMPIGSSVWDRRDQSISTTLQPDSHRSIKIIRILVSPGGHFGDDGGAIKIGTLEPMNVPEIKVQVLPHRPYRSPLRTKL